MKQIVTCFWLFFFTSCIFSAGTNTNAVVYHFNKVSCKELFEKVEKMKMENPEYKLLNKWDNPNSEILDKYDKVNNYYNVYFFLEEDRIGFQCIIDLNRGENNATLLLVAISERPKNQPPKIYSMKKLPKEEKNTFLEKFESQILDKLGNWKR